MDKIEIKPQPKQEMALKCSSKVVIFGGGKGGGKSFALRLLPLYHIDKKKYRCVIFRRTLEDCKKPEGMWEKSFDIYPYMGATESVSTLKWTFPSGASVKFSHLQKEQSYRSWFGTEVATYGFDQLEEFTFEHFKNILGCMRTLSGAPTQLFATVNPIAPHWVRDLVDPWIGEDGYVVPELNGKEFHFKFGDGKKKIEWVDDVSTSPVDIPPISITFIVADVYDNQILLDNNPDYLINLKSQSYVERLRYLGIKGRGGNWNVKPEGGKVLNRDWFNITYEYKYRQGDRLIRFWDFGFSLRDIKRGDFNSDCLIVKRGSEYIVLEVGALKGSLDYINNLVLSKGKSDLKISPHARTVWHQEPGASGARDSVTLKSKLKGVNTFFFTETRDKVARALEVSPNVERGNVSLLYGDWNEPFLSQCHGFPDVEYDDMVDAFCGGFDSFTKVGVQVGKYKF